MADTTRLTTTPKALPPTYSIGKVGDQHIQASGAMALWMQQITNQAAAAIANLPPPDPTNVTTTSTPDTPPVPNPLPPNLVVLGAGEAQVQALPDPGVADEVLVSAGPGQPPRWRSLASIHPSATPILFADTPPAPPEMTNQQHEIINRIVVLLYELVQSTRS